MYFPRLCPKESLGRVYILGDIKRCANPPSQLNKAKGHAHLIRCAGVSFCCTLLFLELDEVKRSFIILVDLTRLDFQVDFFFMSKFSRVITARITKRVIYCVFLTTMTLSFKVKKNFGVLSFIPHYTLYCRQYMYLLTYLNAV